MKASSSFRNLLIASGLYATSSILGPLVLFGGIGWFLDSVFATGPWLLLAGVLIAFVVTNVLLFRKVVSLSKDMEDIGKQGDAYKKSDESQG